VSDDVPAGKLACSASHIAVWKEIVSRGLTRALVLEDDIALRPGFTLFVQRLKRQLPRDFDLVHLYVSYDRKEWQRKAGETKQLFVSYAPRWGRSAYIVSLQGAEKLLADFRTISDHGDVQMARMAQQGRLLTFCASKASVDNLGQTRKTYRGERFPSTVW
jgi:GR25 family glycosyltransferase involved in LPS biosynthesis